MSTPLPSANYRFKAWCTRKGFGLTTGYKLIKEGKVKIVKIGRSTLVTEAEDKRFTDSLERAASQ